MGQPGASRNGDEIQFPHRSYPPCNWMFYAQVRRELRLVLWAHAIHFLLANVEKGSSKLFSSWEGFVIMMVSKSEGGVCSTFVSGFVSLL